MRGLDELMLETKQLRVACCDTRDTFCRTTQNLYAHHMFSFARRIRVLLRIFCCAAMFSVLLSRGSLELEWKQAASGVQETYPCRVILVLVLHPFHRC